MKIICIMQARMGSSRLKGKVLKTICDQTVLEHDIDRLKKSKNISDIIVATTTKEEDDVIVKMSQKKKVKFYRGSEDNVLERYYFAAKDSNADVIVRVTSDCPCMDYNVIDNVIDLFIQNSSVVDYVSNTLERTFPRGYDVEVFSYRALEKAYNFASKNYEKEHVTPYIYDVKNKFNLMQYKYIKDYSQYRVTLDTKEDLEVINRIFNSLYYENKYFTVEDVVKVLSEDDELVKINKFVEQKKLGE